MTKINYIAVITLITATLIFLGGISYHQKISYSEQPLTEKIVSATSSLSEVEINTSNTASLVSGSTGLYEEKSVLYLMILSLSLAIFAGGITVYDKKIDSMKVPLITASLLVSSTIIVTIIKTGLI